MKAESVMNQEHQSHAHRNAESVTSDILNNLDQIIGDDESLAVIYCNSALAAVEILFRRHRINRDLAIPMYKEYWSPVVDRIQPT